MSIAANKKLVLQGGARADNIMWVVAGASSFGAGSRFQGNILGATSAAFVTGSTINGRVLMQTAVTLQMTTVTNPSSPPTANDVATQLKDAASAKNEEAEIKKKEAAEKRAAADQKQQDAIAKRAAADSMRQDADAKKAQAQGTRDTMLGNITDVNTKKKAQLLADAAIADVDVTTVKARFLAASETTACDQAFLRMGLSSNTGVCDISNAISSRRHLLADTEYLVEIMLSSVEINQLDIDAALTTLSAAGVTAETSKEDALVLLSSIPGIDTAIVETLQFEVTAAATAIATAEAAEADAVATESAAAVLETDAAAAETVAVDLATEATNLDDEAATAASLVPPPFPPVSPPPPLSPPLNIPLMQSSSSSSPIAAITGALVGFVIIGPACILSILALFFKSFLRRKLLQFGFRRLADVIVPEFTDDDFSLKSVNMKLLERFLAKQKLPHVQDVMPEISESNVIVDINADVLGNGGYGTVFKGTHREDAVAVKVMFGGSKGPSVTALRLPAEVVKMMRREATIMCSLNHPNILRVLGIVPERGWIVMELCEGGSLFDVLRDPDETWLDPSEMARVAAETATGVAYLHMRDVAIVHGNIKAAHVLLTRNHTVRICYFGMSETNSRSKTMSVVVTGSSSSGGAAIMVAWSAPELLKAQPKSYATDVYALGVTLWELYERRAPFSNKPEAGAGVDQVLSGERLSFTSRTPVAVRELAIACLSKEAKERPAAAKVAFILANMSTKARKGAVGAAIVAANQGEMNPTGVQLVFHPRAPPPASPVISLRRHFHQISPLPPPSMIHHPSFTLNTVLTSSDATTVLHPGFTSDFAPSPSLPQ
jgi:serine/threonine protein kinase